MPPLTIVPQQVVNLCLIFILFIHYFVLHVTWAVIFYELSDVTWIRFLCLLRSAMILQLSSSDVREAAHARRACGIARLTD